MLRRTLLLIVLASGLLIPSPALTQEGRPGRGQARGRGDSGPGDMRERMMNDLREQVGAGEDEWKELAAKIEKVMSCQRDLQVGMGGPGGAGGPGRFGPPDGPGGPGGPGGRADRDRRGNEGGMAPGKVAQALRELRMLLRKEDAPAAEIAAKVTAVREARDKARARLQAAQKELKASVTPRQEAVLVAMGMLD
jgi:hypothetical protein